MAKEEAPAEATPEEAFDIGAVFRTLAASQGPLAQLSRHEMTIERSRNQALSDLERLQTRRKKEADLKRVQPPRLSDWEGGE